MLLVQDDKSKVVPLLLDAGAVAFSKEKCVSFSLVRPISILDQVLVKLIFLMLQWAFSNADIYQCCPMALLLVSLNFGSFEWLLYSFFEVLSSSPD